MLYLQNCVSLKYSLLQFLVINIRFFLNIHLIKLFYNNAPFNLAIEIF